MCWKPHEHHIDLALRSKKRKTETIKTSPGNQHWNHKVLKDRTEKM